MANLVIFTEDASNAAPINTRAVLVAAGHTVTIVPGSGATIDMLVAYDAILCVRLTGGASAQFAVAKEAFTRGVPLLDGSQSGVSAGHTLADSPSIQAGLLSHIVVGPGNETSVIASSDSPIFTQVGRAVPSMFDFYSGSSFFYYAGSGVLAPGARVLATASAGTPRAPLLVSARTGQSDLFGGIFAANVIFAGFAYGAGGYTAEGAAILASTVDYLLAGNYVIQGTVRTKEGQPVARRVRAYLRSTGALLSSTTSTATGTFKLTVVTQDLCTVIALDEDSGSVNAVVADRVVPLAT